MIIHLNRYLVEHEEYLNSYQLLLFYCCFYLLMEEMKLHSQNVLLFIVPYAFYLNCLYFFNTILFFKLIIIFALNLKHLFSR